LSRRQRPISNAALAAEGISKTCADLPRGDTNEVNLRNVGAQIRRMGDVFGKKSPFSGAGLVLCRHFVRAVQHHDIDGDILD